MHVQPSICDLVSVLKPMDRSFFNPTSDFQATDCYPYWSVTKPTLCKNTNKLYHHKQVFKLWLNHMRYLHNASWPIWWITKANELVAYSINHSRFCFNSILWLWWCWNKIFFTQHILCFIEMPSINWQEVCLMDCKEHNWKYWILHYEINSSQSMNYSEVSCEFPF
jgi:hypothetical protein